jgi:hypothetical protein
VRAVLAATYRKDPAIARDLSAMASWHEMPWFSNGCVCKPFVQSGSFYMLLTTLQLNRFGRRIDDGNCN